MNPVFPRSNPDAASWKALIPITQSLVMCENLADKKSTARMH
jgi:hypothetical protein